MLLFVNSGGERWIITDNNRPGQNGLLNEVELHPPDTLLFDHDMYQRHINDISEKKKRLC